MCRQATSSFSEGKGQVKIERALSSEGVGVSLGEPSVLR